MIKLVDISAQHKELRKELKRALKHVVRNSAFIGGDLLKIFEKSFGEFSEINYVTGVSNGTSAIEIALRANGIGYGDEVITVSNTFFATVEAIYNVGAEPVFIDVKEIDGLMDLDLIEKAITSKTRAIIPVHLFGHLVDMQKLIEITSKYKLKVIEDAAQAHGASADWGTPGALSDCATFSFYPGKNLGAWGDAGAIVTNHEHLHLQFQKLRDHGRLSKYEHDIIGTNARMDSLQAAVLSVKLTKLRSWNHRRIDIAKVYTEILKQRNFRILHSENRYQSAWHLFVVRVSNREAIQEHFKSLGIETGIHYPIPLHLQPALKVQFSNINLAVTETLANEIISIPIHPHLTDKEVLLIANEFIKVALRDAS